MSDLPTPEEVSAWEPGSDGLDPYYNRLVRAYLTLWDQRTTLADAPPKEAVGQCEVCPSTAECTCGYFEPPPSDAAPVDCENCKTLEQWVHDLQSGMFINCVYCGHRYGPDDKVAPTMQQALYDHIAECPKHPLSAAKARIAKLEEALLPLTVKAYWKITDEDRRRARELLPNWESNHEQR